MDGEHSHRAPLREAARERPDDVAVVLTELSAVLLGEETLQERLRRVVDLAVRTTPDCDSAGVTLLSGDQPHTAVCTDSSTLAVDQAQYDVGTGPCLDAMRTRAVVRVHVEQAAARWPDFVRAARLVGIKSFLAAPLLVDNTPLGALNLYSADAAGFDALDEAFIALFSTQAAASIANSMRYAEARALAAQLESALVSRAVIEQAKGVLMARHSLDADAAFDVLRRESQHRNIKLQVVAREVVASTAPPGA